MDEGVNSPKLVFEEKKAIILFLWLFYLIYFSFEFFYNYIDHATKTGITVIFKKGGLGIWIYLFILSLIPVGVYFIRKSNPYIVKYIYFICYLFIQIINDLMIYLGTAKPYQEGNIVEVLFIIFSPIFVSKKYFWLVSLGLIGKYVLFFALLHEIQILIPVMIYLVLSAIAYVLLIRFYSYINTLTSAYDNLRQKEKLAIIGQMATAVGHEIRNPLSSLKGFTQLQREKYPNTNDYYPIMIQEIDRINSIVSDLMYLGKPRELKFEQANIEDIIAYTTSITRQLAEAQGITIETIMEGPISSIDCESKQLKQVFINLIKNAIEAMPEGGRIKIKVKAILDHKLSVAIEDEGCGISEENIPNLAEPFFTTKKEGTGLGLMVTNQIIHDHNGDLKFESKPGEGTRVIITLPLLQKSGSKTSSILYKNHQNIVF